MAADVLSNPQLLYHILRSVPDVPHRTGCASALQQLGGVVSQGACKDILQEAEAMQVDPEDVLQQVNHYGLDSPVWQFNSPLATDAAHLTIARLPQVMDTYHRWELDREHVRVDWTGKRPLLAAHPDPLQLYKLPVWYNAYRRGLVGPYELMLCWFSDSIGFEGSVSLSVIQASMEGDNDTIPMHLELRTFITDDNLGEDHMQTVFVGSHHVDAIYEPSANSLRFREADLNEPGMMVMPPPRSLLVQTVTGLIDRPFAISEYRTKTAIATPSDTPANWARVMSYGVGFATIDIASFLTKL